MRYSFTQLEHFYYVYLHSSFIKAANTLGISKAQMSQSIAKLERSLGGKLFHRTTRSVSLSTLGEHILPFVEDIIKTRDVLADEISMLNEKPMGLLKVTCPNAFAEAYLAPTLFEFMKTYPAIRINLCLSAKLIDLEKEKIDVAIRLTHEPPSQKVAIQLGTYQIGYFASPDFLKKESVASDPRQLKQDDLLVCRGVLKGEKWLFMENNKQIEMKISSKLIADSPYITKKIAIDGGGIACLPYFMVRDELRENNLVALFEAYLLPPIPVFAIFNQSRKRSAKLDAFLNYLREVIKT